MHFRTELAEVTENVITARTSLAEAEIARLYARRAVVEADAALSTARVTLMSRSDAGTNDAQRRAYAERETAPEREHLERMEARALSADADAINAAAALRIAEDRRRLLETVVRIAVSEVADLLQHYYKDDAPGDNAPEYGPDNLPF